MEKIFLSGTGFYLPEETISNDELVNSYNKFVNRYNEKNIKKINKNLIKKMELSSADFIDKASGIQNRHVVNKQGILDDTRMRPLIKVRGNDTQSLQCEMAVKAGTMALKEARKSPSQIDGVIIACSNMQRSYPAIAVEVQNALGINGWAFDMNAACSSAVFGINAAIGSLKADLANAILVINPEIYTGHLNFKDRTSHFIFGDGCAATVIEKSEKPKNENAYEIISGKLKTVFSNNIRNNFGFLNSCETEKRIDDDILFKQQGRKVKEDVISIASGHILDHINEQKIHKQNIKRLWLHQANIHMNKSIANLVFDHECRDLEAPLVLSEYGNTGAAGVIICFNKYNSDLKSGDLGIICAFGAGYMVGSLIVKKL
jgi:beta-ketodecanoyl-[acyl-carrier-protein] synthase